MILKALHDYAHRQKLIEDMAIRKRPVHLVLRIDSAGRPLASGAWDPLNDEVPDPKKPGKMRSIEFKSLAMPEYPGVNAGGKAHFLADSAEKVLGLSAKDGEPIPAGGKNAAKAFDHYWKRIADAHEATKSAELAAMLGFRDLFLAAPDRKAALAAIADVVPVGKEGKPAFSALTPNGPVPLEGKTVTFQVGALALPVFADEDSPLIDYWRDQFRRERFAEATPGTTAPRGICLVTGDAENPVEVPIAEVHRTTIKGVPGLPPIGGYLVSFDKMTPSLRSYGFEGGWNAPVSEDAAAAYALGLNHVLSERGLRAKVGDAVLCGWVDVRPELGGMVLDVLNVPTSDALERFFRAFEKGGEFFEFRTGGLYRSLTLAANGGRVVVRRWLDEPLGEVIDAVRAWFDDLKVEAIAVPRKARGPAPSGPEDSPFGAINPFSVYALAATTARVPSEVQDSTYDALYRAALDPSRFNPAALLGPALQRLRIAAKEKGNGLRFDTSRFALIKLILKRSGDSPMPVELVLCEDTNDPAYNGGRLLAVLDDLQRAAQGQVGGDVVSRFYGAASVYPANSFQTLLRLAKAHEKKLKKSGDPRLQGKGWALSARVNEILARLGPRSVGAAPEFPSLLGPKEQGRFALGFHQQKAADDRAIKKYLADKAAGKAAEDPTLEALAEVQAPIPSESD